MVYVDTPPRWDQTRWDREPFIVCGIMPPGNIAHSILEYRRLVFRIIRDPSALVHPPIAPLFLRSLAKQSRPRDAKLVERARKLAETVAIRASEDCPKFRMGDLKTTCISVDSSTSPQNPVQMFHIDGGEDLRSLSRSFRQQSIPGVLPFCLLPGAGYFVCARCDRPGISGSTTEGGVPEPLPSSPRLVFRDASVLVSLVEPDPEGSLSAAWTTLAETRILRKPHGQSAGCRPV